jgi:hypothetical protein
MPNLLKSLPREILEKEDTKFIYNVLNPLLFEKIRENLDETRKSYQVSEMLDKDIHRYEQFDYDFRLPYNIDSRSFHVYMNDGQEKVKLENYKKDELITELDEIKEYIFFYFGIENYSFIKKIIEKYYYVKNEVEKNEKLYKTNYEKYLEVVDVKKKKVYKTTFEYFKGIYDEYHGILEEFEITFRELAKHKDYSINQIVNNIASSIADLHKIKTFDNEIVFQSSNLFKYLNENIVHESDIIKHIFSGKEIIESTEYSVNNIFELMSIFAMELFEIKEKYQRYLEILVDNNGMGYSLKRSEHRLIKNQVITDVTLDLDSDNLTYFIDEENNKLEIYLYFDRDFRIEETTMFININQRSYTRSIISNSGYIHSGFTMFDYFDDTTKYYKITIHDYLIKDLSGEYLNYDIDELMIGFNAVKATYHTPTSANEPMLETTGFLDNFVIYKKNKETGFYDKFDIPFKLKIDIDEKEERYNRVYEFMGINDGAHQALISQEEIIISCYSFDYVYEPKIYVDFFKSMNNEVEFRYHTIVQYTLIDDVMEQDFEIPYYKEMEILDYNTNIKKNVLMFDNKVYKRLFDVVEYMQISNPYNETNNSFVSKITYEQLQDRTHVRETMIIDMVEKLPFYSNLKFIEEYQYDQERNCLVFFYHNKQYILPLGEELTRNKNYENVVYDYVSGKMYYCGQEKCNKDFIFADEKIYIKNPDTDNFDEIELVPTEMINLTETKNIIYYDVFEAKHSINIKGVKYNIKNLYLASNSDALKYTDMDIVYIESSFGIPRYKTADGQIIDVDFSKEVLIDETHYDGCLIYDSLNNQIVYRHTIFGTYVFDLEESKEQKNYHRLSGLTANSIFYTGNALPENTNKSFYGRENIMSSLTIPTDVYDIGRSGDEYNNLLQHELLAEQLDLKATDASKHNMEQEPYLMFKSATSSLKGLESYLKSNLKSISQDLKISPVYLVQRNRFISEWARVSSVLPENIFAVDALKDLVADLMETKLVTGNYDDLMDIFKSNEYEKFSLKTNDIHGILLQYITRYLDEEFLLEDLNYYLIHTVWMDNNRKKILDYIKSKADESVIAMLSTMSFNAQFEKEKLFYTFIAELEKENKVTIESYKPIANYSDWIDYQENNHVKFEKPFRYEMVDISNFITMPIDWKQPLMLIRPLVDDGVYTKRDYRFLDMSMATNSQITYDDAYNEYVEDVKNKLNKPVNYLDETLRIMQELSLEGDFDFLGINLVIVKWIVERFLPNYILSNEIGTVENFREIVKAELMSAEHPNMIVSYNRIKESTLLRDLGSNVNEIYDSITAGDMVLNSFIRLDITDSTELEYLDKIKRPAEHYFDFLFQAKRYDIITKVLALFTEDVIASSMLDLSLAINIKNSKGDETYDIYEKMIMELFDEFLPFHTVLDKIIFTIKIMESASAEAVSKQADVALADTSLIDIVTHFAEKIRIQTLDRAIIAARINVLFPSEGLKLCGGHDEIPYDYDRKVKVGGHDVPMHVDDFEAYGVDDDFYIVNREAWKQRPQDVYTPPEFADLWWECIPENEFEKVVETYLDDYFHIKQEIFERDDRIESYFVDSLQAIGVGYSLDENPDINVTEDYLIAIDSTFNIRFYDMDSIPHDDFGLDEAWGPEDQTSLVDIREGFYQEIVQDFYEKLNVGVMDSIWTDVKVLYDVLDIPGHDEFGLDEYYHQRGPDTLGQEISVMAYDELLHQGFGITARDMSDVSLVDKELATKVVSDSRNITETRVTDDIHVTIGIWAGRSTIEFLTDSGVFIPPGHDEFAYDEFYHDSADYDRVANMTDTTLFDALGTVRVDFGFMRMLPIDPYADLIDQKFYRADQPGSEWQKTKLRDSFTSDVRIYGKDTIRVFTLDSFAIDLINEELRRAAYQSIEDDSLRGDYFASTITDSITQRHIHHDFRENIVALEKYASVLDDTAIVEIFGPRAAQFERDELFELRIGDKLINDIKIKHPVDRTLTQIDKDYLKEIRIEEPDFVDYRHVEYELDIRFKENLKTYYSFQSKATTVLNETVRAIIEQMNEKETLETTAFDRVHYGPKHDFEIDGMTIGMSDRLVNMWTGKIYKDSLVTSVTEIGELKTAIDFEYEFKEERILQPHDLYGHMGYTDESIHRTIESKLTDSLISVSEESYNDEVYSQAYDRMMHDIHYHFGDYIDVVIADSIHTYIHIVKKPWIFPEFDEFGHNEYPHMYSGDSDEFDITTELRDQLKIDANQFLYNIGALVQFNENILVGHQWDLGKDDTISVSMVDDLKVISIGYKDNIEVTASDVTKLEKRFYEQPANISIQDTVWYGYKLREDWMQITTADNVDYGYEDMAMRDTTVNTKITDWLLKEYGFYEGKAEVKLDDNLSYFEMGTVVSDEVAIAFEETLRIDEFREIHLKDDSKANISLSDSVHVEDNLDLTAGMVKKDTIGVSVKESLQYGPGKWFHEKIRGYVQNRLSIYDGDLSYPPDLMIDLEDSFHEYTTIAPFKDSLGIQTYERLKYGLLFKDTANVSLLRDDHLYISRRWDVERYGVNDIIHDRDGYGMEYPDDVSADNSFTASFSEDFKVITEYVFKDTLDILPQDRMGSGDGKKTNDFDIVRKDDGIVITSADNLMYGIGSYDYLWDAKEWENYGYEIPYEDWTGHVPHDDFPYDEMEHQEQGEDLSHIVTGVTDNLLYGFDFLFKDTLTVQTRDNGGFETWGYQSVFKDSMYVWVDNRLESGWADTDDNKTMVELKKEQMRVSYDFDDTVKEHIFTRDGIVSQELINIYDIDTYQLLEQIYKYRIYEELDTQINSNLFTSALFRYDDEMSLVTDWKTKIDLYKEQSDGSVTKSMTLIKDKTSARVELLFGDVINTNVKDKLQGTTALRPDEYLE